MSIRFAKSALQVIGDQRVSVQELNWLTQELITSIMWVVLMATFWSMAAKMII